MNKSKLLGAAIALTMGMSGTAHAFSVNTGFGGIGGVGGFDWSPNSALSVASLGLSTDINNPTQFTLYSQGSLATFTDSAGLAIAGDNGLNSNYEITFESGAGEVGVQQGAGAIFGIDPTATVNFFNMYYDTAVDSDPLEGTGYGASATSKLILTGVIVDGFGSFTLNPFTTGTELLDQFGADNWAGQQTVDGNGSNDVDVDVLTQNDQFAFFNEDVTSSILDLVFGSNATTPFKLVDPSKLVVGHAANFGVDGNGTCPDNQRCDFLFQTDAASTLQAVPEPSTIALLSFGLIGMAATARRKRS